ncbi:helix-turn-helix transcriptional regulator [Rhizobium halophytocola]|uniref:DNA-binding transcriptional regulator YafY n=1 Tax=Rhizobium halophytocola TaxID=735519 RepID=A0ABS4DY82_9HYPH|nr:YafY family protein [Rhizobium halophytocola]MBP1850640.1 putative DNA-binding transcriptional regulator YafY [Rhizobium halophytocola]
MRASRLINILTTLQARGLVTAEALAAENEVSVRTIYRDIDALSLSGVPVYSERGSDGGYRLLDGYRVRLNGMSPGEAEAMFLSGLPGAAADLGLGSLMAGAHRKLTAALPEELRRSAARMQAKFHLDAPTWFGESEQPLHLQAVADAVWNAKRIRMRYRAWKSEKDREVEPLGIVLKGGAWYLAGRVDDSVRTYRIARILDLVVTDRIFERPKSFDLAAYWRESTERLEAELYRETATLRLSYWGMKMLEGVSPAYARSRMETVGDPDADGWQTVRMPVGSTRHAVSDILRLSTEVEVIAPEALRTAMAETTAKIAGFYRDVIPPQPEASTPVPAAPGHGNDRHP